MFVVQILITCHYSRSAASTHTTSQNESVCSCSWMKGNRASGSATGDVHLFNSIKEVYQLGYRFIHEWMQILIGYMHVHGVIWTLAIPPLGISSPQCVRRQQSVSAAISMH